MKKAISMLLCLGMLLALCACGETRIESYEDDTTTLVAVTPEPETVETAETAETVEQTVSAGLDWAAAYAMHEPDEVVIRVDGDAITWQELFYELANVTSGLQSSSGTAITSWYNTLRDSAGNEALCGDYVLSYALTILAQYHCVYSHLTAEGVTLSAEGEQYVQDVKQTIIDNYFGGDKDQFLANLNALFCSEEMYDWFNMVDELYAEGFSTLYGVDGADLTDEQVLTYGEENDYVQIRQIYIYPDQTSTEETTETAAVDTDVLDPLAAQLGSAVSNEAREELFGVLYDQYNENEALDVYGASRAVNADDVSIGSVDATVYSTALLLEDYGYACVAADDAAVLVMRVPMQADAPVYYETAMDKLCDLRYYAATQLYLQLINGEEGWIASAQLEWEPAFEGFNLFDAFGENTTDEATETAETASDEPSAEPASSEASEEPTA